MSHKTRHFKPDPLHYCHFAPIFLQLLNPLHVHAIASMWKMSHNRQMFKTLQQTNPQHFCHLCCGINTVLQVSRRSRPVSFFATFTNSQITQMSRKKPTRYISATFTSSQILPPNHRSRLNATKEAISDSHPLLYLIQNYDKYTSGNRIAIFRASINN